MILGFELLRLGYVCLFAVTAVVCFSVIPRARNRITDPDTRWGLTTLLAFSGFWAAFHVGRLVAPIRVAKISFYILGLLVGLATVGSWLYFCSAYASESYHRQRSFRWAALGVYAGIVSLKLTSPIHGLYFTTVFSTTPFPHLVIQFGLAHWIVTGFAYALSAVGFYILYDLFQDSGHATTRLGYLVGLAGLPVVFDLIGYTDSDWILTFNYEPVGVALFALGVLYIADGTFLTVRAFGREQLVDELDEAIILLDEDEIIRDVNASATRLFPTLSEATGERLETVAPAVRRYLRQESELVTMGEATSQSHYLLSTAQLTVGQTVLGQAVVFTEVTEIERQRRQIQQQRSQLDDFSEAITHELRNTLNVLEGHIDLVQSRNTVGEPLSGEESLETASQMTTRMKRLVSDLATLAKVGHPAKERTTVDIQDVAERAFATVGGTQNKISVQAGTMQGNRRQCKILFEKLFEFALLNGGTHVDVRQTTDGLTVTSDCKAIDEGSIEAAFAYGQAVPDAETGMLLPVAQTLVEAQGWKVSINPKNQGGVQAVIET